MSQGLQRYEALMLAVPELTKDEATQIEKQVDEIVRKTKGTVISFEKWGKFRLSYPVNRKENGVYMLARFEIPNDSTALHDLRTIFAIKLNLIVMRYVITNLQDVKTLVYQRPKSLDEIPDSTDSRGSYMKDHRKIEGLISAVDSSGRSLDAVDDQSDDEDRVQD